MNVFDPWSVFNFFRHCNEMCYITAITILNVFHGEDWRGPISVVARSKNRMVLNRLNGGTAASFPLEAWICSASAFLGYLHICVYPPINF
jgi:hypothetical protein